MIIISTCEELEEKIFQFKKTDKKIGFIPTMGALHQGHISLIDAAKQTSDIIIVSIFVNPTQFTSPEDFEKYPNTLETDLKKLEAQNIDIIFTPSKEEIYALNKFLWKDDIHLPPAFSQSEGLARPGHFEGVYQVLHRFFSIIQPDNVYFGQKDFQQILLVHVLIHHEFSGVELYRCPIFREKSGLAMSSRNTRFSAEEKNKAKILSQALYSTQENFTRGVKNTESLEQNIRKFLDSEKLLEKIYYIEFRNINSFEEVLSVDSKTVVLVSCQFAGIHLIDNLIFG